MNDKRHEILEIPKYKTCEEILRCEYCFLKDTCCKRREWCAVSSLDYCSKIGIVYDVICIITLVVTAILIAVWLNIWYSLLACIGLIILQELFEKILEKFFVFIEKKRRNNFDKKVEKIKEHNQLLEKAKNGSTKEFEEFEKVIDNCMIVINESYKKINDIRNSSNDIETSKEDLRVYEKYTKFLQNIQELKAFITPTNFKDSAISTFYNVYLTTLVINIDSYIKRYKASKITVDNKVEFGNLLEVFSKKCELLSNQIQEKEAENFSYKMKALNKTVLPDDDGSEEEQDNAK